MFPYVIAGIAGMYVAGRNAPRTKFQKMKCLGPRTGLVYDVELIPLVGIVIVHAVDGTVGVFQQNDKGRFLWLRGHGTPDTAKGMRLDLEP
jgi:hypothetical protein